MKYNSNQSKNTIESPNSVGQFNIEINAKAYSILMDGIYSNKIKAIIRELSTNAWDSHIEANNLIPFDVHLPQSDEEYFYVRDYGTGLSEESIINVYTQVFKSTKDTSNQFNGCLGIGRLSPYSYNTRTFHIESFFNGKKYIYAFFMNDEGIPSYTKIDESDTKEPNGLKVQLSVTYGDFQSFYNEAEKIYKFFVLRPKFIGKQIFIKESEKSHENNGVYISDQGLCVIMGNVCYPITLDHKYFDSVKDYKNSQITIHAKIGEVDFSSSRESLSYTQKTLAFIKRKLEEYKTYIESYLNSCLDSCENEFAAALCYEKISKEILFAINSPGMKLKKEYKGKPLVTSIDVDCSFFCIKRWQGQRGIFSRKKLEVSNDNEYFLFRPRTQTRIKEYLKGIGKNAYLLSEESVEALKIGKYVKDSNDLPKLHHNPRRKIECYEIRDTGFVPTTYTDGYGIQKENNRLVINQTEYSRDFIYGLSFFYKIKIIGFSKTKFQEFSGKKFEAFYNSRIKALNEFFENNENDYNHYLLNKQRGSFLPGTNELITEYYKIDSPIINFYKENDIIAKKFIKNKLVEEASVLNYRYNSLTYSKFYEDYKDLMSTFKFSLKEAISKKLKESNVQIQTV